MYGCVPFYRLRCKRSQLRSPLWAPLAALLTLVCIAVGCRTSEGLPDASDDRCLLSAAEHYEAALEKAHAWKPDAYLSGISVVASSCREGYGPPLIYNFHSPSTRSASYGVTLFRGTWTPSVIPKGPLAATRLPIEREDWSLDSVDAWPIALASGGRDFLLRQEGSYVTVAVNLEHLRVGTSDNVLVWRVLMYTLEPARHAANEILIHPKTGEVLEVIRR